MKSMLMTAGISFIIGLIIFPVVLWLLKFFSFGQNVRKDGPETHQSKQETPTMGGIGIIFSFLVALSVVGGFAGPRALVVIIITILCFLIGFSDDLSKVIRRGTTGVKARYRFIAQVLIGLGLCAVVHGSLPVFPKLNDVMLREPSMIWMPFGLRGWNLGWWYWPFGVLVFVGTINSVNFTDGLDGLLAGCFLAVCVAFTVFIWRYGERSLLPVCLAMMGVVLVFLWLNCHPAKLFMGDCGSMMLGGFLASIALLTRSPLFLFVVGFVFVAEALSVIFQVVSFRLTGRRVFRMSPIHHHFELAGWAEPRVVVRFWIAGIAFAGLGMLMFL